jgi:hypothetical protein
LFLHDISQVLSLRHYANRIFNVQLNCQPGAGLGVNFPDFADMLQDFPAQVLFDEQYDDVSLGGECQAEEALRCFVTFTARIADDSAPRSAGFTGCPDDVLGFRVFDKDNQ